MSANEDSVKPTPATASEDGDFFLFTDVVCGICGLAIGEVENPADAQAVYDAHRDANHTDGSGA